MNLLKRKKGVTHTPLDVEPAPAPVPAGVVAVFYNPATGQPCWTKDPPPGYKTHGSGEFYQFIAEFPYFESGGPDEAIAQAKTLYWSLIAPK